MSALSTSSMVSLEHESSVSTPTEHSSHSPKNAFDDPEQLRMRRELRQRMMSTPYPVATVIEPSHVEIGNPVQPLILAPDRSTALLMNMAADRRRTSAAELENKEKGRGHDNSSRRRSMLEDQHLLLAQQQYQRLARGCSYG
ncbi:hypothetical protein M409DRAFT_58216 [Zasmidium cellare ATCC 36951]|uniref:Uncharacterized protein n=1 Tax=Zasmidium cellare ATCC 36951 TaxID=1080233 RepID=A0A6A6C9X4_ZASCE|nr:uncharacterized protein M409DRAFT_58216 [Zasmidium cellare ATCC 36951]KAF2162449.1 hypothetical protein M409DRAFT_58216 [Zasmidium cellare ATCC 36951]